MELRIKSIRRHGSINQAPGRTVVMHRQWIVVVGIRGITYRPHISGTCCFHSVQDVGVTGERGRIISIPRRTVPVDHEGAVVAGRVVSAHSPDVARGYCDDIPEALVVAG